MPTASRLLRTSAAIGALIALSVVATACQPEPDDGPAPTASPSIPSATGTPSGSPTATPSEPAAIALPDSCDDIYSPGMRAALDAENPPLNDPGVTMTSTDVVEGLELLDSGIPTIRCSWGTPSEYGLATNVSIVTPDQSGMLLDALTAQGFGCDTAGEATICRIEQQMVDLDDNLITLGEVHALRENVWISTATISFDPEGYTEDIIATLWG